MIENKFPCVFDKWNKRLEILGDTEMLSLEEILRLATSIQQGTVTASLMFRKLGSYQADQPTKASVKPFGTIFMSVKTHLYLYIHSLHAAAGTGEAQRQDGVIYVQPNATEG